MSSTEEDYIQNEYYAYNQRLLRLIGLWDYQRSFKKLIYVCFINLLIIIAVFELIYAIINSRRELDSYTDLLQNTLPILCTGSCYYNLIWNNVIIKKIFYRMNYDWNAIAKKKESIKLKEYAKLSRKFTVAMIISFYLYVIFLIFPSFLRIIQYFFGTKSYNELELPVHFDHFAKYRMSYYPVLCLQYIVTIISCTTGVANYSIFIAVILHACALFNVVVWKINERFRNNCYSDRENVNLSEENEWIIDIIKFYRTVLEFIRGLNKVVLRGNSHVGSIFYIDYHHIRLLLRTYVQHKQGREIDKVVLRYWIYVHNLCLLLFWTKINRSQQQSILNNPPNSVLFAIIEDAKNTTIFHNEKHEAMQFIMAGSIPNLGGWSQSTLERHNRWHYVFDGGRLYPERVLCLQSTIISTDRIMGLSEIIYAIINSRREFDSYTELLQNTLPILCTGSCYYNLIWNNAIIKKIFYRMNYDWNVIAKKKESIMLKKYAKLSRNFTVAMIISFYLYVIFLIFPSFLRIIQYFFGIKSYNELDLPIQFDHFTKYRMSYYSAVCLQYVVTIILCTTAVANYSIFIAIILHACALFNVVVWKINERFENNCYSDSENVNLSEENEWIIDVLTSNISKTEELTKLSYVIGSMFTIFAYFYFGQRLIDHSTKLPNSVLFVIIEDAKNNTIFHNEKHEAMQFIMAGSIPNLGGWSQSTLERHNRWHYVFDGGRLYPERVLCLQSTVISTDRIMGLSEIIYAIFNSRREFDSYTELLQNTVPILCTGSCYYNLIWNNAVIKKIFYRMNYDWNEFANKKESMILKKYAKLSRKCTVIIIITCFLYLAFLIVPSFLRIIQYLSGTISYNELVLPIRFDHFMKYRITYYFGLYIQYIILTISCTIIVAHISMFIAIVLHVCALFSVVVWKINERYRNNCYSDSENVYLSEENEWIIDLIKFYRTVVEFVLTTNISKTEELTKLSYVIGSMFAIFAYFYFGQRLIDHSTKVFLTISMRICNLSWQGAIVVSHNLFTVKSLSFAMVFQTNLGGWSQSTLERHNRWHYVFDGGRLYPERVLCLQSTIISTDRIMGLSEIIYAIFNSRREFDSYTELLQNTLPILCTGSCYYNLIWNNAVIKKIFYRMNYDWNEFANKKESMILKKYAKLSRKCTVVIIITCFLYLAFLIVPSFLRIIQYLSGTISYNELVLPIRFDHFMKYRITYYFGLYIQYIILTILCTIVVAHYSMFIAIVLHVCALFSVVVWKINERYRNNCYSDSENVNLSEENEWIIDVIKFYRTVVEFVLTTNISKTEELTKLSYVIGSMFTIFAYFYFGQRLIDHSTKVFLTISMRVCNLSWQGAIVVSHNLFTVWLLEEV
ncbi:odorant receptor 46a-like isoform X1 [Vespula maculifrons]|uniref:Odorant receptor 46a-like isoform X1 n=1 Tax=Vespula maculifrons TaxID=7453 RepID=A0ABD2BPF4_VESMC